MDLLECAEHLKGKYLWNRLKYIKCEITFSERLDFPCKFSFQTIQVICNTFTELFVIIKSLHFKFRRWSEMTLDFRQIWLYTKPETWALLPSTQILFVFLLLLQFNFNVIQNAIFRKSANFSDFSNANFELIPISDPISVSAKGWPFFWDPYLHSKFVCTFQVIYIKYKLTPLFLLRLKHIWETLLHLNVHISPTVYRTYQNGFVLNGRNNYLRQ